MIGSDQRVLSVTQAAAKSGKSRATILRKLASKELRGKQIDGRWVVDGDSLAELESQGASK
jgi:hypothetical protein